jgi:hypothetical protein
MNIGSDRLWYLGFSTIKFLVLLVADFRCFNIVTTPLQLFSLC